MVKAALYLAAFYLVYFMLLSRDTSYRRNRAFHPFLNRICNDSAQYYPSKYQDTLTFSFSGSTSQKFS